MLEFLKRLTWRGKKASAEELSPESPSWHPGRPPQPPEQKDVFSTLQPDSAPPLEVGEPRWQRRPGTKEAVRLGVHFRPLYQMADGFPFIIR